MISANCVILSRFFFKLCIILVQPKPIIEDVYYLQNYAEGWTEWEEKMDIKECIQNPYILVREASFLLL